MRAVWRQDGLPSCNIGAECGRAEEKCAGYQSAEVYPRLMQNKCACNSGGSIKNSPPRYKNRPRVERNTGVMGKTVYRTRHKLRTAVSPSFSIYYTSRFLVSRF